MAVNVANLGRKPYWSLSADVISILQNDLGMPMRGEIIWRKAKGAGNSCAWGSFPSPANAGLPATRTSPATPLRSAHPGQVRVADSRQPMADSTPMCVNREP